MERRRFTREFKLEAVRLIRERGVSYAQASQDLNVHPTQLRNWVKAFADDPQQAFPGQGQAQARSAQAEGRARHPKKSRGLLREGIDVKFGFIVKHRGVWAVDWMCGALGVSRGGFYAWLTRPRSRRSRSNEELGAKVRVSFIASDRTYGARRVWHDLLAEGIPCGLHRIERLMRLQALKARPRQRRLPPDLGERQIAAVAANRARPQLRGACAEPQMDRRLHLCVDGGRLALRCCRHRSVLTACSRLVDECGNDSAARYRCPGDGDLAAGQARRAVASLRPRQPIYQRAVPEADGRPRRHLLDEPLRQRLGQCGDGELLLVTEDRAHRTQDVSDTRPSQG